MYLHFAIALTTVDVHVFKQDKKCTYVIKLGRVRATVVAVEKQYSECVFVALFAQHALRMHLLPSVACPALQYFSTLFRKRHDCRKINY
jgi:hypothetical protein